MTTQTRISWCSCFIDVGFCLNGDIGFIHVFPWFDLLCLLMVPLEDFFIVLKG